MTTAVTEPMAGIRVLEVALFGFVPSAGAILADWGADVIKVEHPVGGDPVRAMAAWGIPPGAGGLTYLWEVFNRGKRAVAIDLRSTEGRDLLLQLVDTADVFLTNFLPAARRTLGIDAEDVMGRNPRIVYARGSAHGVLGSGAESGGFDGITYWSATGASLSARPRGHPEPIPMPGPGFGDIQAGSQLAGGVAAALLHRERTGRGVVVDHSLLAAGLWAMQPSIAGASVAGVEQLGAVDRRAPDTPLGNWYRTADDRWVFLGFNDPDRHWPPFCHLIGRPDLLTDERFATQGARMANLELTVELLDGIFAERALSDWRTLLAAQDGPWAVHRTPAEAARDPQSITNGYTQVLTHADGATVTLVAAPAQFDGPAAPLRPAPGHGQHTDEVLRDLGHGPEELDRLKDSGVIRQSGPNPAGPTPPLT